jgi:hypothetical protein
MDSLPNELIKVTSEFLIKITDNRNFARSCILFNLLLKERIKMMQNKYMYSYFERIINYNTPLEFDTINYSLAELCYDKYFHLVSNSHLDKHNLEIVKILSFYGTVDLLKYVTGENLNDFGEMHDLNFCCRASISNNSDLLKYAINQNCVPYGQVYKNIAFHGNLELFKWLKINVASLQWDIYTCSEAALNGHFELLKWIRQNGCEWDMNVCSNAALNGHFEILKWARQNGCEWTMDVCSYAALNGHFEILKWARKNGCEWNSKVCSYASLNGHLELFKWARKKGCEWNLNVCSNASKWIYYKMVEENGCSKYNYI